ncbi:T9SS type A sorting domain-containing protein [Flavobacterium pectinovorum]|uniref:T9SS type A sorting domain-containing protein n=1 Tax=Flavobacterium pectinovorum TaxID=29533 RepID=UPI001FADFF30|nr:T9SS type A sorting domain-containing protein [Flavobacterium pectinovorum]MCI9844858.1 T9SS type A sorting domain-containing protein [Flavobacterium pectinovorum]
MKMKITLSTFLLLLLTTIAQSQNITIPDTKFKDYLVANTSINTNGDAEISKTEAEAFTGSIGCSWKSITNLSGIEAFINLTSLDCEYNSLTSLDLSANVKLQSLYTVGNNLTALNLSSLVDLKTLECNSNKITSLDLSKNTKLERLRTANNKLTALNVSKNLELYDIGCENNLIEHIDISLNVKLTSLDCRFNKLKSLNLNNGKTLFFNLMKASGNTGLTCIQVDDMNSVRTGTWVYDNSASFSTNCQYNLGVNDVILDKNTVKVYPNPANQVVTINSPNPVDSVKIYSISGALVKTITNPSQVEVSNWSKGLYFFVLQIGNQYITKEILVN